MNKFLKKSIVVILCLALLSACKQTSKPAPAEESAGVKEQTETELTLNNGAKWTADSSTTHHVADLRTIANMFKVQPNPSLKEYHILGDDVGNSVNKMIQDCKMTGPAHEALHKWLHPILNETNQLKNATDTSEARTTFNSIDKQLNDYPTYFQNP